MKEFKLTSWPELPSADLRTGHRRALSSLSQRFLTVRELVTCTGLSKPEAFHLLDQLAARGVLKTRERHLSDVLRESLQTFGERLHRRWDGLRAPY